MMAIRRWVVEEELGWHRGRRYLYETEEIGRLDTPKNEGSVDRYGGYNKNGSECNSATREKE
jgi:hypothetical protein